MHIKEEFHIQQHIKAQACSAVETTQKLYIPLDPEPLVLQGPILDGIELA